MSTTISVIHHTGKVLAPCSPARARILVDGGVAVWSADKTSIVLMRDLGVHMSAQPSRSTVDVIKGLVSFSKYFETPRDVYIRNVSEYQISLGFTNRNGEMSTHLIKRSPDPINLTQFVSFDVLKESEQFRRLVNRNPQVVILLTEEEFTAYFQKKAERTGDKTADQLAADAYMKASEAQSKVPDQDQPIFGPLAKRNAETSTVVADVQDLVIKDADVIHPRLLSILGNVSHELPDEKKMIAPDLLGHLETLSNLKIDDYEYIVAHGYWKSVRNWARMKQAELTYTTGEGDG
jgi:hypothetical protein